MQNRMVELGYMDAQDIGQFWGHYGPRTEAAVRSFQRANGISPANGVADGATLAAMASPEAVDAATYRANMPAEVIGPVVGASADGVVPTATAMTADDQARVQQRLTDLGYLVNRDAMDAESIRNYQIMNSLPGTGELDQATLNSMWSADAKISTHIVQFHEDRYNPTKSGGGSNNCGPASVAMALAATGLVEIDNQDPQALVADMRADSGTEAPNYTGPADLYTAAEANGAAPYYVNSMDDVDTALANGDPVVLFGVPNQDGTYYAGHDMGSISPPPAEGQEDHSHHWITVLGYDPKTDTYTISDPLSRDGVITCARSELETYADFSISSVAVHNPQ